MKTVEFNLVMRRNSAGELFQRRRVARDQNQTGMPSAAKHFASSRPMPDDAPVIKTVSHCAAFMPADYWLPQPKRSVIGQ